MKNLSYLFLASIMFIFVACAGEGNATKQSINIEETNELSSCSDECQKACCLGCKAIKGDAKCIILADGSMPCCIVNYDDAEDTLNI